MKQMTKMQAIRGLEKNMASAMLFAEKEIQKGNIEMALTHLRTAIEYFNVIQELRRIKP